jgi:lon-related putative ATP-dependent protease
MTDLRTKLRLAPEHLRWTCRPEDLTFATTADLAGLDPDTVGQERAVRALDFGLSLAKPEFHIVVVGPSGTGRRENTTTMVRAAAKKAPTPPDWCYVFNFQNPDQPRALSLPAGQGHAFVQSIAALIAEIRQAIRKVLSSEHFELRKRQVLEQLEAKANQLLQQLDQAARTKGFLVQRGPAGIATAPLGPAGQPMEPAEFEKLTDEEKARLEQASREVQEEIGEVVRSMRAIEREARESVTNLERSAALAAIREPIERLQQKYADLTPVVDHLTAIQEDVIEHLDAFREEEGAQPQPQLPILVPAPPQRRSLADRYAVNLVVDNSGLAGAPVIYEPNPTYYNLVGKIEYRGELGTYATDHRMIKAGALLRANGGYFLVQAKDILVHPGAYEALKRALRGRELRIENLMEQYGLIPTATLRPEPIPLSVKVVVIATPDIYMILHRFDEDFRATFRVKAEFDTVMPRTPDTIRRFATLLGGTCAETGMCHCDSGAVAKILEYAARLADAQDRLSTRFGEVRSLLVEAIAWAQRGGDPLVTADHVRKALDEKIHRSSLIEEKIQEMFDRGQLFVDTDGALPGQINGLSVLMLGDYAFGRPSRITARTFVGARGVVNIEREINQSGPSHSKGVMILGGYLGGKYARHRALSLSATVTFEQTYSEVDGDSASSTELYALLSALSEIPIDQGIAVTGSVNQRGEVQPIGGVNEKIEGFYAVCKAKGLTGRQGVMIPQSNAQNLMLREDVVEAVREGRFHVWGVRTVDEGIEILMGAAAGALQPDGSYPEGSVHAKVLARLEDFAERLRPPLPTRTDRPERETENGVNDKPGAAAADAGGDDETG